MAEQLAEVFSLPALAVGTSHPRLPCLVRQRQWWECIAHVPAELSSPVPVVEYLAPAPAVIASASVRVFLTRTSSVSTSCAYCGVPCTRTSIVSELLHSLGHASLPIVQPNVSNEVHTVFPPRSVLATKPPDLTSCPLNPDKLIHFVQVHHTLHENPAPIHLGSDKFFKERRM